MLKINKIVLLALVVFSVNVRGQNAYNSAFTRYGLGDLFVNGNTQNKALGGTGIALQHKNQINTINPASYITQDTMSFIFDFGVRSVLLTQKTSSASNESSNYNLDHIAISFPITKWWHGSLGLLPYSTVGYKISNITYSTDNDRIRQGYGGDGGVNKFYIGSAFSPISNLSIGLNASYLFGSLNQERYIYFDNNSAFDYNQETQRYANGFVFNTGVQYGININPKNKVNVGIIYDFSANLNTEVTNQEYKIASAADTIDYSTLEGTLDIPQLFGAGFSYQWANKILVAFDYKTQDWSKANVFESLNKFSKYSQMGAGIQFTPNKEDFRHYFNKIQYRIGVRTSNAYIRIPDESIVNNDIKDQAVTFGLGFPFKSNTFFNVALEYGKRGSIQDNMLEEKYTKISFNVSLYDFWFYKPKYD